MFNVRALIMFNVHALIMFVHIYMNVDKNFFLNKINEVNIVHYAIVQWQMRSIGWEVNTAIVHWQMRSTGWEDGVCDRVRFMFDYYPVT